MVSDIIERYLYDLSNARTLLMDRCSERHSMAHGIIGDVLNYFVDHLAEVDAARRNIAVRSDPESLRMLGLLDEFIASHANACEQTKSAFIKT